MNKTIHISLRAGESIFVNGAMLRVDRKTTLEFVNNATFLLESHILKPEEAVTPLKKMYMNAQKLLTEPASGFSTRQVFYEMHAAMIATCPCPQLSSGLMEVKKLINNGRNFEALKLIRKLFKLEADILARPGLAEAQEQSVVANRRK